MINLENLLDEMQKTKVSLQEVKEKLLKVRISAASGAGAVKATVDGHKKIRNLQIIDESLLHPTQKKTLEDLTIAAINLALQKLESYLKEELNQTTNMPNLLDNLL